MLPGWIKLHRTITDHPMWLKQPFTWGQAWVDLLMLANSAPGNIYRHGVRVEIDRGEVGYSIKTLATRWHWSHGKVERFLAALNEEKMVSRTGVNSSPLTSRIKITNYEKFQEAGLKTGSIVGLITGLRTGSEQEVKEVKKKELVENGAFDAFWRAYPRKVAKPKALASWTKMGCDSISEKIMAALEAQKSSEQWARDNGKFIPHPATWLNQERWDDEVISTSVEVKTCETCQHQANPLCQRKNEAERKACTGWRGK